MSRGQLAYLAEVMVLHALRTLRDWICSSEYAQEEAEVITVRAGPGWVVEASRYWFARRTLSLRLVVATPLTEDILGRVQTGLSPD